MSKLRVLQIIDSLHAGGAERMAVNLANELALTIEKSFLCATREEGLLKKKMYTNVGYLFLNRKHTLDIKAIRKLKTYIEKNKINTIHAHSSSYFIASIVKYLKKDLKLIWHDHYGNSEYLNKRNFNVLKFCSLKFDVIISVNSKLQNWAENNLRCKNVYTINNFATVNNNEAALTILHGKKNKRLICLANLRSQKDHMNLLEAFKIVLKSFPDWTLHLVGKDFNDVYANQIKAFNNHNNLSKSVYIYGSKYDTQNILSQSTIGVLSSKSEGLPLALLEYGLAKLPVVCTNVGDCELVISNSNEGILVLPNNIDQLANAITVYILDKQLRKYNGNTLFNKVMQEFSASKTIDTLISIYSKSV